MTMHLVRGMSSLNTKKRKSKTNKQLETKRAEHEAWLKSMSIDDASLKRKLPHDKKGSRLGINELPDLKEHQSHAVALGNRVAGSGAKVEEKRYTGTLIKGIATMHKSNAVPIMNKQEAIDVSNMRRG